MYPVVVKIFVILWFGTASVRFRLSKFMRRMPHDTDREACVFRRYCCPGRDCMDARSGVQESLFFSQRVRRLLLNHFWAVSLHNDSSLDHRFEVLCN